MKCSDFVAGIISKSHSEYMEELIDKQVSLTQTLRLLSLYSMIEGGLKAKSYDNFRREITQVPCLNRFRVDSRAKHDCIDLWARAYSDTPESRQSGIIQEAGFIAICVPTD